MSVPTNCGSFSRRGVIRLLPIKFPAILFGGVVTSKKSMSASGNTELRNRLYLRGRSLWLGLLAMGLISCAGSGTFQAYPGDARSELQVAQILGESYLRQDWLNRYVDSVRFARVDDMLIEESPIFNRVEVTPGFHDVRVYFYWDLGTQRGLAQALVQYASTQDSLSRTLRFNALAGERYTVRAEPVFKEGRRDITNIDHVNFWVEDSRGNLVVSREAGRFSPVQ